jgi:starch phosphorylase
MWTTHRSWPPTPRPSAPTRPISPIGSRAEHGLDLDPDMMFDVQIKRLHEYKRQHMNILEAVAHWQAISADPDRDWTPRVKIFAGKAAPGYHFAKDIIRLINDVATCC